MLDAMKELGNCFIGLFNRFIGMDLKYIVIITLLVLVIYILLSYSIRQALILMNVKVSPAVWVPIINIAYFLTKSIHSLMAVIFFLILFLIIPIPHPVKGVLTVSSIVSNKLCHILYMLLFLELIISLIVFIVKYMKYERSIRVVR